MFAIFKKKVVEISAPVSGRCIKIEDVPDKTFSQKILGDGIALIPEKDTICAPIDGTITMLASTGHAFGIRHTDGLELLIHVGMDTVRLGGSGFTVLKRPHENVRKGEPILILDMENLRKENIDLTTMVVVTETTGKISEKKYGDVAAGEPVMTVS